MLRNEIGALGLFSEHIYVLSRLFSLVFGYFSDKALLHSQAILELISLLPLSGARFISMLYHIGQKLTMISYSVDYELEIQL